MTQISYNQTFNPTWSRIFTSTVTTVSTNLLKSCCECHCQRLKATPAEQGTRSLWKLNWQFQTYLSSIPLRYCLLSSFAVWHKLCGSPLASNINQHIHQNLSKSNRRGNTSKCLCSLQLWIVSVIAIPTSKMKPKTKQVCCPDGRRACYDMDICQNAFP